MLQAAPPSNPFDNYFDQLDTLVYKAISENEQALAESIQTIMALRDVDIEDFLSQCRMIVAHRTQYESSVHGKEFLTILTNIIRASSNMQGRYRLEGSPGMMWSDRLPSKGVARGVSRNNGGAQFFKTTDVNDDAEKHLMRLVDAGRLNKQLVQELLRTSKDSLDRKFITDFLHEVHHGYVRNSHIMLLGHFFVLITGLEQTLEQRDLTIRILRQLRSIKIELTDVLLLLILSRVLYDCINNHLLILLGRFERFFLNPDLDMKDCYIFFMQDYSKKDMTQANAEFTKIFNSASAAMQKDASCDVVELKLNDPIKQLIQERVYTSIEDVKRVESEPPPQLFFSGFDPRKANNSPEPDINHGDIEFQLALLLSNEQLTEELFTRVTVFCSAERRYANFIDGILKFAKHLDLQQGVLATILTEIISNPMKIFTDMISSKGEILPVDIVILTILRKIQEYELLNTKLISVAIVSKFLLNFFQAAPAIAFLRQTYEVCINDGMGTRENLARILRETELMVSPVVSEGPIATRRTP